MLRDNIKYLTLCVNHLDVLVVDILVDGHGIVFSFLTPSPLIFLIAQRAKSVRIDMNKIKKLE